LRLQLIDAGSGVDANAWPVIFLFAPVVGPVMALLFHCRATDFLLISDRCVHGSCIFPVIYRETAGWSQGLGRTMRQALQTYS
jgi:hypothetical protein